MDSIAWTEDFVFHMLPQVAKISNKIFTVLFSIMTACKILQKHRMLKHPLIQSQQSTANFYGSRPPIWARRGRYNVAGAQSGRERRQLTGDPWRPFPRAPCKTQIDRLHGISVMQMCTTLYLAGVVYATTTVRGSVLTQSRPEYMASIGNIVKMTHSIAIGGDRSPIGIQRGRPIL